MKIAMVPGLTEEQEALLSASGIRNCRQLVHTCRRPEKLATFASRLGFEEQALRGLAKRAALCLVRGIGPRTMVQLVDAGVDSLEMLTLQDPETLRMQLRQGGSPPPNLAVIEFWIEQARRHIQPCSGASLDHR